MTKKVIKMRSLYFFALFLVLYELSAYLANDMIMPGMIQIIQEFHASQSYVALSLSYYTLGTATFMLVVGGLAEYYGKGNIMLIGNIWFLLFTLLILCSQDIHQFMLWRFLQGGGLAIISLGYSFIHENFNDKQAIKLIALMSNISLLAPLTGPVWGSLIVSHVSWRYIFALNLILSTISLVGLYHHKSMAKKTQHSTHFKLIFAHYWKIITNKPFFQGTAALILTAMPLLLWIGQAPNLILYKLQQNYNHFMIYQVISASGMVVASIAMQFLTGKYRIYSLVKFGRIVTLIGILLGFLEFINIYILVIGLFIYTFGLGVTNSCIFRLVISNKNLSSNMVSAMIGFLQSLCVGFCLILVNKILHYFNFAIVVFTLSNLICVLLAGWIIKRYMQPYAERQWE